MDVQAKPCYTRILLKLSGEALMGEDSFGINRAVLQHMIEELRTALDLGVQVGIVVGGGNIFRGVALGATGMDRATGDYMGMLATVMNAMALQDCCRNNGIEARVQSALNIEQVAEPYIRGKALRHLRNRMAHELDTDGVCTEADAAEAGDFHARILSGNDPLARLNRMAAPERKPPKARMPEKVSRDSGRRKKPERNIWIGIAITAAVICLIALIPIIFL